MKQRTTTRKNVKVKGEIVATSNNLPAAQQEWKTIVATFIASQDIKQSSRDLYTRTLSLFFLWVQESGKDFSSMKRTDILEYKDTLLNSGRSSLTVASYLVVVRKFYEWTEACKLYPNIAKDIDTPKRKQMYQRQHLSDRKAGQLLQHFMTTSNYKAQDKTQQLSGRDFAIVNLMLRTGLRTIEVSRANIGDITFKRDKDDNDVRVLMIWGKGRDDKKDFVVLTDKAYQPIKEYLSGRGATMAGEPLFISESRQNRGQRLTTRTISGICKQGLIAVGLEGREYTAHSLRHTAACALIGHGASLDDVQRVMRHSDPATTQIYLASIKESQKLAKATERLLDAAF